MGHDIILGGYRLPLSARIVHAAALDAAGVVVRLRPVAALCARQGVRLLLHGGTVLRIATATVVALTVTMCSYWAQSSGRPATAPLQPADIFEQHTTAKSDRLDAYAREERAASVLANAPMSSEVSASLAWPLADRISAGVHVGPRGERAYGIRISVPGGTPVRAAADGIVDFAGNASDGYGKKIILKHGEIRTVYAHLSEIAVAPKAKVRKGQLIARSGQSGFTTSPRLYLGLLGADPSVDPIAFFAKAGTISRCAGGGNVACADRKPPAKAAVTAPLQERPPVPPSDIPHVGPQRAATL